MKIATVAASLACAFLLAATAAPADAKTSTKKHKRHAAAEEQRIPARRPAGDTRPEYIERDAGKLRFGSSAWWEQMLRENRLSCCN